MALKGALKRLPEDHHEVIWLRRHEQRSFEEIAVRLGAPRRQRASSG
jgi:DNA-directed RNA polymerase specialized sigma24 family protein